MESLILAPVMAIFVGNLWCAHQTSTIFLKKGFISKDENPTLFRTLVIGNIVIVAVCILVMKGFFAQGTVGYWNFCRLWGASGQAAFLPEQQVPDKPLWNTVLVLEERNGVVIGR